MLCNQINKIAVGTPSFMLILRNKQITAGEVDRMEQIQEDVFTNKTKKTGTHTSTFDQ